MRVDRSGLQTPIEGLPNRAYDWPRLSPDGTQLAMQTDGSLATWDFGRRTLTRLTFGPGLDNFPIWTPDGRSIIFGSTRGGVVFNLYRQRSDGSGAAERVTTTGAQQFGFDVRPDGSHVVAVELQGRDWAAALIPLSTMPDAPSRTLIRNGFRCRLPPNGRFVACDSDDSGRSEVTVRPFPRVDDGRWQVSTAGGRSPVWSRDGRELFYVDGSDALMVARVQTDAERFSADTPVKLFDAAFARLDDLVTYDVSADRRFIMTRPAPGASGAPTATIVVVTNGIGR